MLSVKIDEVRRFMEDCLHTAGASQKSSRNHAHLLLHADLTGHFSHGLNRLEFYIKDLECRSTNPSAKPVILKETVSTAWVDGGSGLGADVAIFCMDVAIMKAKEAGVGWVVAKRCTHFGMAGYWAQRAKREGLIGLAFTNTSPVLVPTRAKENCLGTNPIAVAAPALGGDSFVVDQATTAVALGKIEVAIHKSENIPEGWALGPDGKTTTNAEIAFNTGHLLPLGGMEETSGYKGYGLSAMVELFCGILGGSQYGHHIRSWNLNESESENLGQCFVAVDPECFAPGFGDRLADCLQHWRNLEPVDPAKPVLAPGDKESIQAKLTREKGFISYAKKQIDACNALAMKLRVKPLEVM